MTHQAGRELDALIAERVMGWSFKQPRHGSCCTCQNCGRDYEVCDGECYYSTDIAVAWPIAQKLGLALVPQSDGDGFRWLACDVRAIRYGIETRIEPILGTEYSADTAPLAICLAALAAAEKE